MPDMFSPCFDLAETKTHPFNHLPLKSNPYMTPDTTVCREEWQRLVNEIKAAYAAAEAAHEATRRHKEATEAEKEAAFEEFYKMMRLERWVEKENAVVNAYCDWVDICEKFSDSAYLAAIYDVKAFHSIHRVKHWESLVKKVSQ
jgi:hypothetical protein